MHFDDNHAAQGRALSQQRTLHESTSRHQADQQISQQNFMTTILEQIRQNRSEPNRHSDDREGENYFSNKDAIKEIPCYEKGSDIDAFFRSFESRLQLPLYQRLIINVFLQVNYLMISLTDVRHSFQIHTVLIMV